MLGKIEIGAQYSLSDFEEHKNIRIYHVKEHINNKTSMNRILLLTQSHIINFDIVD
jgi:hypothetical protein